VRDCSFRVMALARGGALPGTRGAHATRAILRRAVEPALKSTGCVADAVRRKRGRSCEQDGGQVPAVDPRDAVALDRALLEHSPQHDGGLDPDAVDALRSQLGGQFGCATPHARRELRIVIAVRGVLTPSHREDAAVDSHRAVELLCLQQKDSGRADEDVIEIAVAGLDIVD